MNVGPRQKISLRGRRFIIVVVISLLPTILLVMQSINQLTIGDILLVTILGGLMIFYASKIRFRGTH